MLVVSRGDVRHHLSTLLALLPDYYQHRPCHRHIHHLLVHAVLPSTAIVVGLC